MQRNNLGVILIMSAAMLTLCACSPEQPEPHDSAITEADYAAARAPAESPAALPAEFIEHANSREVKGQDGWYIYARRDPNTGRLVELIIANSHPAEVRLEDGRERVIFRPNGKGEQSFAGNTNMLAMLKFLDTGRMQMQIKGLPALTPDPVAGYQDQLQTDPDLPLGEFIATCKELAFVPGLKAFFDQP